MRTHMWRTIFASVLLVFVLGGCVVPQPTAAPDVKPAPAAAPAPTGAGAQPAATQAFVQEPSAYPAAKLDLDKFSGPAGTRITMSGTGYPASQEVAITWKTFDGRWLLEQEEVVFIGPRYDERTLELGKTMTDAGGAFKYAYTVPEDFGGVHDIFTRIGGKLAAKTAFTVTPSFAASPVSGPVGTPITIRATGLGYRQQLSLWEVAWDNGFTGYMTGVNTRGTATAQIRMAGPPGPHMLKIWRNYRGIPYLNPHQGPFGPLPESSFVINVTDGLYPAATVWEHPKSVETVRTPPPALNTGGASLSLSADKGTVGAKITISGAGFPAGQPVKLNWATRTGQKITATGLLEGFEEELREIPAVTSGSDGKFSTEFTVFSDYAGYHRITAESGGKKAEAYYSIYANIAEFKETVKVGEPIKIRLKGVGWNIQGKTYGVTFDNKYLGYICSFSTKGYIELDLPPQLRPGLHLIDLYPMVYEGKDPTPNIYSSPNLTYMNDHPGGALPSFRLTLKVVE